MWANENVFYQIYPLGFCGAERTNDFSKVSRRLTKIEEHIDRLKDLGVGAVLFNPLFMSQTHGYDTIDFFNVDSRLGDNDDFKRLVSKLHDNGMRVVLDGVFNHVGRAFKQFNDVLINRENSGYKDWFNINFHGNSCYNDGFRYEGWEGHFELVKLNLNNPAVVDYLLAAVKNMIENFGIDGLRLDVCYLLPDWFLKRLKDFAVSLKPDFFLVGEIIHGDYNRLLNAGLHSVTNYECYKGLYSAINASNLFEIEHSLSRQFGDTNWSLYKGRHLMSFADNHDVTRAYSVVTDKNNIENMYAVLFAMPGIPCLYYGSEVGCEGVKGKDDNVLRPRIDDIDYTKNTELFETLKRLIKIRTKRTSLNYGSYRKVTLNNKNMSFMRESDGEKTLFAVNIANEAIVLNVGTGEGTDLMTGAALNLSALKLEPYSFVFVDVK